MIRRIALVLVLFVPVLVNSAPIRYELTLTASLDNGYYDHAPVYNNLLLPTGSTCDAACHVGNYNTGPSYSSRAQLSFVSGTISAGIRSSPFFAVPLTIRFYGDTDNIASFPDASSSVAAIAPSATGTAAGYYLAQGRATVAPITRATALSGVRRTVAGYYHSCALNESGQVLCWGENYYGQLGLGNFLDGTAVPSPVMGLPARVSSISSGDSHTCALASGEVWCWGYNRDGELGNGTTVNSAVPVQVSGLPLDVDVTAIVAGGYNTCALTSSGAVYCWGSNYSGQIGSSVIGGYSANPQLVTGFPDPVRTIALGYYTICAVTTRGAAYCLGANYYGQLGNNSTTNSSVPVPVSGLSSGVRAIAAGDSYSCAIDAGGNVWCWGYNGDGELGNNTYTQSPVPVPVVGQPDSAREISTGGGDTCVVTVGGTAFCWGYNGYGQLGNDSGSDSPVPAAVSGLTGTVGSLASGYYHNCAVLSENEGGASISCWGRNRHGQLGRGGDIAVAAPVLTYATARPVSASFDRTAGLFVAVDGPHHAIGIGSGWPAQVTPNLPGGIIADTATSEFANTAIFPVDSYDLSTAFGPMTGFDLINGSFPFSWPVANAPLPLVGGGQLVLNNAEPTSTGQGEFTAVPLLPASSFKVFGSTSGPLASASIYAHGTLTLDRSAKPFNPASDDLVLGFGPYTALLPAGSLSTNADSGALVFSGNVNGTEISLSLNMASDDRTYDFQVQATKADLNGVKGAVEVQFYLGDNAASGSLSAASD